MVCFPWFFLYIVLSAVQPCNISHCFIQSPLLFPSSSVCLPTLVHSVPQPSPSSALTSPPTIGMHFLQCFSIALYIFNVVVCKSRVGDALVVYHDRGSDNPFVDVFGFDNLLPPLPVQHNSNSVFVVVFSCSHESVFWVRLPNF